MKPLPAQAVKELMHGNAKYHKKARIALPMLIMQADIRMPITYGSLASELQIHHRVGTMPKMLGCIGYALKELEKKWIKGKIPQIQCLVIDKKTRMPSYGFEHFDKRLCGASDEEEHRCLIEKIQSEVYEYKLWPDVLQSLKLEPITINFSDLIRKASRTGGRGESLKHKRLKRYVANNPDKFPETKSAPAGEIEYSLPSGDSIDVVFTLGKSSKKLVAVEVKPSGVSDGDILRGMYQCIKYKTVLQAKDVLERVQERTGRKPTKVYTFLVIGGSLPKKLRRIKNILEIKVYEGIVPEYVGSPVKS